MKKLKLSLSICMMCFCISFLYFGIYGVYAAQKITYSISGTITYEKEGLTLYDSGTYYYANLGYTDTSKKTPIQWRYLGYETTVNKITTFNQITYTKGTIPKIKSGAIFVQETALGTFDYVYDGSNTLSISSGKSKWNSSKTANYFTDSSLRTSIREGGLFNLTEDEEKTYLKSGYINARNLPNLDWSYYNYKTHNFSYPYENKTVLKNDDKKTDYFWLLSVYEACLYFNDPLQSSTSEEFDYCHTNIQWKPSSSSSGVSFWLRSPCYGIYNTDVEDVTGVYKDGSFYDDYATELCGVRAAFQLA